MRLAALTMVYNEPVWAGVWARFYARQVGAAHCFMLDHGSNDGSTERLPIQVERMARSPLDEDERVARVSARVMGLLEHYDAVVHSDVDELIVADPRRYRDLVAFAQATEAEVVTAAGLDVQHLPEEENALETDRGIGEQRQWVRFSAAMCKPAFIRRPVRWTPGFHRSDAAMATDGLFLFHLRYADLGLGLARLERTRTQPFANAETNLHQRVSDQAFERMLTSIAQLPREEIQFDTRSEPLASWLARVESAQARGEPWLTLAGDRLWRLPRLWRSQF